MVDGVMTQHDGFAELESLVAKDEIVGAIVGCDFESAHAPDGFAPEGHGGPEHELHAFHGACCKHSTGHFDRHANGLNASPESSFGCYAPVRAGHSTNIWVGER